VVGSDAGGRERGFEAPPGEAAAAGIGGEGGEPGRDFGVEPEVAQRGGPQEASAARIV
jgi:hypothetical protein